MLTEKLHWMKDSDNIADEIRQCKGEGRQIEDLLPACDAVLKMDDSPEKEKRAAELLLEMEGRPVAPDFPYDEPESYEDIQKTLKGRSICRPLPEERRFAAIKGAWTGRAAGCLLGIPVEGWPRKKIRDFLNESGQYPLRKFMSSDVPPEIRDKFGIYDIDEGMSYDRQKICWINNMDSYPVDDDMNYTMLSLRVTETDSTESFKLSGRGEMHLSILIETMRREGYEFQVGAPKVLLKEENGKRLEPYEELVVDVPEEYTGSVMEKMGPRKGELQSMAPKGGRMELKFIIPARGLFGYRSEFLTDTRGEGIMASVFHAYGPWKGEISGRQSGSLIAFETGEAVAYGLYGAQERGTLFLSPGEKVYAGMVVGSSPKGDDMTVNVCKRKHLTNTRASGSDDALRLIPPHRMSLEESLEFLAEDELLEVTPGHIRIRKRQLDHGLRMREASKKKNS